MFSIKILNFFQKSYFMNKIKNIFLQKNKKILKKVLTYFFKRSILYYSKRETGWNEIKVTIVTCISNLGKSANARKKLIQRF